MAFLFALGGQQNYTHKKCPRILLRIHTYSHSHLIKGDLRLRKFYSFSRDVPLTQDVLVLDASAEVFICKAADPKEEQNASEIGQRYIEITTSLEDYVAVNPAKHFTSVSQSAGRYAAKRFWNAQIF